MILIKKVYKKFFSFSDNNKVQLGFFKKAAIGIFSGGVAAFIGTPTEVALIRYVKTAKWINEKYFKV